MRCWPARRTSNRGPPINAYDSTEQITQEVLRRFEETPDPRLRQIMLSLVRRPHAFAKDVKLTSEEWLNAMQLLQDTGKWRAPGRNEFIILSDALGLSMLTVTQEYRRPQGATEPTLLGPFLVEDAPRFEMGSDISAGAVGTPLHAQGRVLDLQGQPVPGAVIDV